VIRHSLFERHLDMLNPTNSLTNIYRNKPFATINVGAYEI